MKLPRFYLVCVITIVLLLGSCVTAPVEEDISTKNEYDFSQYEDCVFTLVEEDGRTIISEGTIESIHIMVKFRLICPHTTWTGSTIRM